MMSFIPCSANCVFQNDGACALQYATVIGRADRGGNDCLHYIPRNAALRNAQWHAAPPRYSVPESGEVPPPSPGGLHTVWE